MWTLRLFVVSVALLALSCGRPAPKPDVQISEAAASPQKSAIEVLSSAARKGDQEALGQLRILAEGGVAEAQITLASAHANVPELRDHSESARWYLAAALQGLPIAQASIGGCYAHGRGVEKDLEKAVFWLKLSADQGQWLGLAMLGDLYRGERRGDAGDFVQAYRWYTVGAKVLTEMGRDDILETMLARRSTVVGQMTAEQIAEAEGLAADWVRQDWSELESRLEELG